MSEGRRAKLPARRKCVDVVIERDGGCVFVRMVARSSIVFTAGSGSWEDLRCSGVLDAHEPAKRSHGADPTNPDECICLCRRHHNWAHAHPKLSEEIGLLVRSGPTSYSPLYERPRATP